MKKTQPGMRNLKKTDPCLFDPLPYDISWQTLQRLKAYIDCSIQQDKTDTKRIASVSIKNLVKN